MYLRTYDNKDENMPWWTWDTFNKVQSSATVGIISLRTFATRKTYKVKKPNQQTVASQLRETTIHMGSYKLHKEKSCHGWEIKINGATEYLCARYTIDKYVAM